MKISARNNKKVWEKPAIDLMNIKRDTFGGSGTSIDKGNPGGEGQITKKL